MRGRLILLIAAGSLLAGCSSSGVLGGTDAASTSAHTSAPAPAPTTGTTVSAAPSTGGSTAGSTGASSGSSSGAPSVTGAGPLPGEDAAVVVGVGKTPVTIYEDYRCGPCKATHDKLQPALSAALGTGKIKVEIHAVDVVDHSSGGKGSAAAANAASCAFKAGKFQPYREALFAAQPAEADDAFGQPDKLIEIAKTVPGLDGPAFEDCVHNQPYAGSIESTYTSVVAAGKVPGVPAILINGTLWPVPASGDIAAAFTQAVGQAG